ncbi:hypothetical protein HBI67_029780 [Parastagonospora nodorum]|nr:hypothetical protein HBI12_185160 [Parastagonospora nodorum]KAH5409141.1 hypothetical protein HBI47_168590 [Parastagonospora nodorum]KAH6080614.1 hypothetical protein HBI66_067730 [Parastagonospora nodorum]KAH6083865.1 hypothetical protein HBI67_029780 [Parastagonospora nodorum]
MRPYFRGQLDWAANPDHAAPLPCNLLLSFLIWYSPDLCHASNQHQAHQDATCFRMDPAYPVPSRPSRPPTVTPPMNHHNPSRSKTPSNGS